MVANGWTARIKELEEEIVKRTAQFDRAIFKKDEEIRILTMRLDTAIRILDEIAEIGKRIN